MTNNLLNRPSLSAALNKASIEDDIAEHVSEFRPRMPEPGAMIITERQASHGKFADNARVSQALKHALRAGVNWDDLPFKQREALDQIAVKMGRIVSGDPGHSDHWHDIQGYALLGEGK